MNRTPLRGLRIAVVVLLAAAGCSATEDPSGPRGDVPHETPTAGAPEESTSAGTGGGAGGGDPQPGEVREIGTRIASWREEAGDERLVHRDEHEAVLTSQEEWDAWTDSLVVELGMRDDLAADIDFSTSAAVAVGHFECGTDLVLVTDGTGAVAGQEVSDEPGVHVDCAWSPLVLALFEIELDELGAVSVDELRLDDTLTVSAENYSGASG